MKTYSVYVTQAMVRGVDFQSAKKSAEFWRKERGGAAVIREDTETYTGTMPPLMRSSRQPDSRWQALRARVTAEIEELKGAGAWGECDDYVNDAYVTANETILEWMAELESEAADGNE